MIRKAVILGTSLLALVGLAVLATVPAPAANANSLPTSTYPMPAGPPCIVLIEDSHVEGPVCSPNSTWEKKVVKKSGGDRDGCGCHDHDGKDGHEGDDGHDGKDGKDGKDRHHAPTTVKHVEDNDVVDAKNVVSVGDVTVKDNDVDVREDIVENSDVDILEDIIEESDLDIVEENEVTNVVTGLV